MKFFLIEITGFFPSIKKFAKTIFKIRLFSSICELLKIAKEFWLKFNTLSIARSTEVTELNKIIEEENLNKEETYKYVNNAFKNGYVQENGIQINKVLPPLPIIDPQKRRQKKRETVIQKIIAFFNRFRDISTGGV